MRISDWSSDVCSSDLLLEDDGDGVLVLRHRDGELTASEEAGCLAGDSRQVGFRKDGDQVVLGQGIDQRITRGIADVTAAEARVVAGDRRQRLQAWSEERRVGKERVSKCS